MIIIEKSKKDNTPAWGNPLIEERLFPEGKIPPRRRWSNYEVVLNGVRTGVIIIRKAVMFPESDDVVRTKGSLKLLRRVDPNSSNSPSSA